MPGIQKFLCHAIRQKSLADSGISIEKQVMEFLIKGSDKIQALTDGMFYRVPAGESGSRINLFCRVIII